MVKYFIVKYFRRNLLDCRLSKKLIFQWYSRSQNFMEMTTSFTKTPIKECHCVIFCRNWWYIKKFYNLFFYRDSWVGVRPPCVCNNSHRRLNISGPMWITSLKFPLDLSWSNNFYLTRGYRLDIFPIGLSTQFRGEIFWKGISFITRQITSTTTNCRLLSWKSHSLATSVRSISI